jgi:hypothetical protein
MTTDTSLTCQMPVLSLISSPYSIEWGSDIYAKVIALNVYGASIASDAGNGAKIITNPDAPLNLAEDYSLRTATSLGLTWGEGLENGGSVVLDYEISYDDATNGVTYSVLESNILGNSYLATGLTSGSTYKFKV